MQAIIDLRSDTVTRPSEQMRAAMAAAEVGDDVYGEDPTVNLLEKRAAEAFGREAAIFVPSGTMGNQIAIRLHTQPGQEIIADAHAHIIDWEMATAAVFSGCLIRPIHVPGGVITWRHIEPLIYSVSKLRASTGLIEIENTHNLGGGRVYSLPVLEEIWAGAKERRIATHCDGARIFNAAVALGTDVKTLTRGFDTVMFCLSKGLGAPVGSMLVGSAELMDRARVYRKALGGGMRQAGILAAAGLMALEEGPKRLHEDHANARLLAEVLSNIEGVSINLRPVETNIIIFRLAPATLAAGLTAPDLAVRLKERGVLVTAFTRESIRLVTHLDVSRGNCVDAAVALTEEIESAMKGTAAGA
jgi:threonine aldolase